MRDVMTSDEHAEGPVARAIEEQALIEPARHVVRNQRPRRVLLVPLRLEKAQVFLAQLADGHRGEGYRVQGLRVLGVLRCYGVASPTSPLRERSVSPRTG